jgi:hypothetical protein
MASLILTKMFINFVATGEAVSGDAAPGRSEDYKVNGRVGTYGAGRQRAIATLGEAGTFTFQLRYVSRSTVDTLHLWIQQLVQVRDARGRLFYGVYFQAGIDEVPAVPGSWCATDFDIYGAWHIGIALFVVTTSVEV